MRKITLGLIVTLGMVIPVAFATNTVPPAPLGVAVQAAIDKASAAHRKALRAYYQSCAAADRQELAALKVAEHAAMEADNLPQAVAIHSQIKSVRSAYQSDVAKDHTSDGPIDGVRLINTKWNNDGVGEQLLAHHIIARTDGNMGGRWFRITKKAFVQIYSNGWVDYCILSPDGKRYMDRHARLGSPWQVIRAWPK